MWQASIGPTDAQKRGHTPSSTLSLAGTCEGSEMLEGQAVEGDEDLGQTTLSIQATAQVICAAAWAMLAAQGTESTA